LTSRRTHRAATGFLATSMLLGIAVSAAAQVGRLNDTTYPRPFDGQVTRFPDVAYDSANNAYLVVWGLHVIGARYVSADGVPLGSPVQVNTGGGGPVRAACSAEINACLLTWIQEPSSIIGRFVRYSGGSVALLSAPFTVNSNGLFKLSSAAPDVAYSPPSNEFLVAWTEFTGTGPGPDVKAQRVHGSGALLGGEIWVAGTAVWEGFPSVAFMSSGNQFTVAYQMEPSALFIAAQRIQAGNGALIGGRSTLYQAHLGYPELAHNKQQNDYLAINWGFAGNGWMLTGQRVDANLEPIGGVLSLAAGGGGDGIGLAYNPVTNSYLAVYQSQQNDEVWAVEINGSGGQGNQFQFTVSGTKLSVQPRVDASTASPRFLGGASENFGRTMAQLVGTGAAPPPPPTPPPPAPPPTGGCTTPTPGPGWVCVGNGWLPPGHPGIPGSAPPPPPPPAPAPPPPSSGCSTASPGPGWVCVGGGWLPPGHPGIPAAPAPPPPAPVPPPSTACTTPQPGPDWVCDVATGNWLPPGMACAGAPPAAGWVCFSGNWLPPDHPLLGGSAPPPSPSVAPVTCTTPKPGADWVCDSATGNWLPAGLACGGSPPGAGWVCYQGNWLPPGHPLLGGG
jgi:hypothetical protein